MKALNHEPERMRQTFMKFIEVIFDDHEQVFRYLKIIDFHTCTCKMWTHFSTDFTFHWMILSYRAYRNTGIQQSYYYWRIKHIKDKKKKKR